jgi:hypothetical protein
MLAPFALADAGQTHALLTSAGWSEVAVEQLNEAMPVGQLRTALVASRRRARRLSCLVALGRRRAGSKVAAGTATKLYRTSHSME